MIISVPFPEERTNALPFSQPPVWRGLLSAQLAAERQAHAATQARLEAGRAELEAAGRQLAELRTQFSDRARARPRAGDPCTGARRGHRAPRLTRTGVIVPSVQIDSLGCETSYAINDLRHRKEQHCDC